MTPDRPRGDPPPATRPGLVTDTSPPPSQPGAGPDRHPVEPAPEAPTRYMVVFNPPEDPGPGYGVGWTLVGVPSSRWHWTLALAARGAGVHADPRTAKAVAVRVLAEQGVHVDHWSDAQPGWPATFHARLRTPTEPPDPASGPAAPPLRLWRIRRH